MDADLWSCLQCCAWVSSCSCPCVRRAPGWGVVTRRSARVRSSLQTLTLLLAVSIDSVTDFVLEACVLACGALNLKKLLIFKNQKVSHKTPAFWLFLKNCGELARSPEPNSSYLLQPGCSLQLIITFHGLSSLVSICLVPWSPWIKVFHPVSCVCLWSHLTWLEGHCRWWYFISVWDLVKDESFQHF